MHQKLWRNIPRKFEDLLEIAAYVYSCDASTRRGQQDVDTFGAHWQRPLSFHVPVREPDFWNSPGAQAALRELLEFLSDDYYDFKFYKAKTPPEVQQYFKLEGGDGLFSRPERVALFSGGLDSLAGAVEEGCGEQRKLLLVNHRSTDKFCRRHDVLTQSLVEKARPVPMSQMRVQINKAAKLGTEYTQRARSFLYAAMGATVARMLELEELTFFENGVVGLNLPVCAQVAGGRSTRTTHPRVIRGMERLFTLVSDGKPFRLRTPYLWDTKAEVIRRIVKHGGGPLIGLSRSCAETIGRSALTGAWVLSRRGRRSSIRCPGTRWTSLRRVCRGTRIRSWRLRTWSGPTRWRSSRRRRNLWGQYRRCCGRCAMWMGSRRR